MTMGTRAACLGIAFLLSGCVGTGAGQPDDAATVPRAAPDAQFGDDTGAITGLVSTDELQPLAGAQVGLRELPEKITTTDPGGAFTLSHVPPGTYTIDANALGFVAQAKKVTVVAGNAAQVQFLLAPVPVLEPHHLTYPFNGYIDCAFAVVRTTLTAGCGIGGATTSWQEPHKSGWPTTWVATVVEAEWSSSANPDWLAFDYNDRDIGYFGVYYRYRGTSPVHFVVERCGDYRATDFGRGPMPCTDDEVNASTMHVETFYVGKFQEQTHLGDPVCRENLTSPTGGNVLPGYQAGCYGAGVATELRWTNWLTVFHVAKPEDLARFSARPDA